MPELLMTSATYVFLGLEISLPLPWAMITAPLLEAGARMLTRIDLEPTGMREELDIRRLPCGFLSIKDGKWRLMSIFYKNNLKPVLLSTRYFR
jgi:hypothetical protein